ncbi:SseB family protein [Brachybacterium sp. DNPG3]
MSEGQAGRSTGGADGVGRALPAHFVEKSPLTDTAGVPWKGRDYTVSPFPGDDGAAPPAVAEALRAHRAGEDPYRRGLAAAIAGARLLVPIMAVATETGTTAHGLTGDNGADMAMVSITAPDGSRTLPVFTAVAELARWQPKARPVPTPAAQAAQAAVQEGITQLVLDPASDEGAIILQRSVLWALAQGREWIPPHEDPELAAELRTIAEGIAPVFELIARPGQRTEVDLLVRLAEGLDAPAVQQVVAELSARLGASMLVADRVTSLKLTLGR